MLQLLEVGVQRSFVPREEFLGRPFNYPVVLVLSLITDHKSKNAFLRELLNKTTEIKYKNTLYYNFTETGIVGFIKNLRVLSVGLYVEEY